MPELHASPRGLVLRNKFYKVAAIGPLRASSNILSIQIPLTDSDSSRNSRDQPPIERWPVRDDERDQLMRKSFRKFSASSAPVRTLCGPESKTE
jgi:hypothetical protein